MTSYFSFIKHKHHRLKTYLSLGCFTLVSLSIKSNEVYFQKWINYSANIVPDSSNSSSLTKKVYVSGIPIISANPVVGVAFGLALNGVFCIGGNTKTTRYSSVTFVPTYTTKKQATVVLRNFLYLKNDEYIVTGDLLWKKFPNYNNGLGAETPEYWANEVTPIGFKFSQVIQKRLFKNFYSGLGFNLAINYDIKDGGSSAIRSYLNEASTTEAGTVWENINNAIPYVLKDETQKQNFMADWKVMSTDSLQLKYFNSPYSVYKTAYGNTLYALGLNVGATYDSRDNLNTPQKGIYASAKYEYYAKGLVNQQQFSILSTDLRIYKAIVNEKNILAFWNYNAFAFQDVPFILLPANASDPSSTGTRGYKGLRYRGFNYISAELEYRRHIWKALGLVGFVNAHTVSENSTYLYYENKPVNWDNKFKHLNLAYGLGTRILLNKLSRATLNFDYAWDVKGNGNFYMAMNAVF